MPLVSLCAHLRGLARAFPCREPVAPASGALLRPPSRARPGVGFCPAASPSLLPLAPLCGLLHGLAPGFSLPRARRSCLWRPSAATLADSPRRWLFPAASPSLLSLAPLSGHPRGLAPAFSRREPVAPASGALLRPPPRARPGVGFCPAASPSLLPLAPFCGLLRGLAPALAFVPPRARRSCLWRPSAACSAGSPGRFPAASRLPLRLVPFFAHLRGLARAFPCREPVASAPGAFCGLLRGLAPGFSLPRARRSCLWGPSAACSAGSPGLFPAASPSLRPLAPFCAHLRGLAAGDDERRPVAAFFGWLFCGWWWAVGHRMRFWALLRILWLWKGRFGGGNGHRMCVAAGKRILCPR